MGAARIYYVYILASGRYGTLYIGVTITYETGSIGTAAVAARNS
jgi:hypothetical protein